MISKAACRDALPFMFEDPGQPDAALNYCAVCPVRAWCLRQVQPATSRFDGVAGGHVWRNGTPVDAALQDHVLVEYMRAEDKPMPKRSRRVITQRKQKPAPAPRPNTAAVRDFLDGFLLWEDLRLIDRQFAAAYLMGDGWTAEDAMERCGL